jgi:hypothetical protein
MKAWPLPWKLVLLTLCALLLAGFVSGCSPKWKNLTREQRLEDFNYLFDVLKDNHPDLAIKARTEGYDWASHRNEFEKAVRASPDDGSFARTIAWILAEVNNAHTNIAPQSLVKMMADSSEALWNEGPWTEVAQQTSPERIDYWYALANATSSASQAERQPPFLAVYSEGKYVVVAVAPDKAIQETIKPGMTVLEVNGRAIQDYVAGQRGAPLSWRQRVNYDPMRKRLYQRELVLPAEGEDIRVTVMNLSGQVAEVQVPYARERWNSTYSWPPKYSGESSPQTANLCTDTLAGGKVGYLQIGSLSRTDADTSTLRQFFESIRDLPALIIDMRGNGGGDSTYWVYDIVGQLASEPVEWRFCLAWRSDDYVQRFAQAVLGNLPVEEVSKTGLTEMAGPELAGNIPQEILTGDYANPRIVRASLDPLDSVGYRGRIFVLVDDLTYSSAEQFAAFCKSSGFAIVVGTWTGGDGIGVNPALVSLPNSGMVVRFPSVIGLNPDFTANQEAHTFPDVFVDQSLDDILAYLAKPEASGERKPDPACDAALRTCLALALEEATK